MYCMNDFNNDITTTGRYQTSILNYNIGTNTYVILSIRHRWHTRSMRL